MKRSVLLAVVLAAMVSGVALADTVTRVDPGHSDATFSVKHLTISTVTGIIPIRSGKITVGTSGIPTDVQADLDLTKIDSRNEQRDGDLRSDHWFNVEKYPTMTFRSTKISGNGKSFSVVGDLSMRGVTKPVTLTATLDGSIADSRGKTHYAYTVAGTVDRTAYDLGSGYPTAIVGNDITLSIHVETIAE